MIFSDVKIGWYRATYPCADHLPSSYRIKMISLLSLLAVRCDVKKLARHVAWIMLKHESSFSQRLLTLQPILSPTNYGVSFCATECFEMITSCIRWTACRVGPTFIHPAWNHIIIIAVTGDLTSTPCVSLAYSISIQQV